MEIGPATEIWGTFCAGYFSIPTVLTNHVTHFDWSFRTMQGEVAKSFQG